jgi:hypothetical protein
MAPSLKRYEGKAGQPMNLAILAVMVVAGFAMEAWQASLDMEWLRSCEGVEISLLDAAGIRRDAIIRNFSSAECPEI